MKHSAGRSEGEIRALRTVFLCCLMATAARGEDPPPASAGRVLTTRPGPVAFSPNGKMVLTGGADGDVTVWDARSGERVQTVTHPAEVMRAVAWSPDGRLGPNSPRGAGPNPLMASVFKKARRKRRDL